MKKTITIEYDVVSRAISLDCDTCSTFEALGLLEAAKALVMEKWLKDDKDDVS